MSSAVRALVVDDDPDDYLIISDLLSEIEDDVIDLHWEASYDAAIARMLREDFDIFLLDYRLGEHTGVELLRAAHDAGCRVPAILLTGFDARDVDDEARAVGAASFIPKHGLTTDVLERSIHYVVEQANRLDEVQAESDFGYAILDALSAHLAAVDADGTIIAVNHAWRSFAEENGFSHSTFGVGSNYLDVCAVAVADGDRDAVAVNEGLHAVLSGREQFFTYDYPCHSPSEHRWFALRITALNDEQAGRAVVAHETITERKRAEGMAAELAAVVTSATEAIFTANAEGLVTNWNRGAERLFGYTQREMLGQPVAILVPEDRDQEFHHSRMRLLTGEPTEHLETVRQRKDGSLVHVAVSISGIVNPQGEVIGASSIYRDITERKQAEAAIRQSENRFRGLIQHASDMVGILDANGVIVYESPAIERWLGYPPEELVGRNYTDVLHPDEIEGKVEFLAQVIAHPGEHLPVTYRCRHKDGSWHWIDATVTNLVDALGIEGIVINGRDITERKHTEMYLLQSEERFRSAFEDAAIGMALQELHGTFLRVNRALCVMTGYDPSELIGKRGAILSHPDDVDVALPYIRQIERGEISTFMIEKRYRHKQGHTIWVFLNVAAVRDADGTPMYCITQIQDISQQREMQDILLKHALHDQLTGLPSRVLLRDRATRALVQAQRHHRNVAVLFLDLDNFKFVNDSLGHAIGDELLTQVASRLNDCLRAGDTASRLGGDEFAILLPEVEDVLGAIDVATRVHQSLSEPFALAGRDITVTVSIGIALSSASTNTADNLLRHADVAMYRAKNDGKSRYAVFDATMHASMLHRLEIEHDLRRAIDAEQFAVFYQPKVSLDTGAVVGMEALVRWQHPLRGLVSPDDFIPIAEETGQIIPLGKWVLTEAARQTAEWNQSRPAEQHLSVSVNLSPRQFRQSDLVAQSEETLLATGLDPKCLILEITESVVMDDPEMTVTSLNALKGLGIQISIDDFGTGYSSLAYLKRFPVDVLKIDRSFVSGLGQSDQDTAIVVAIISMAHALSIRVVAEGVETREQAERLKRLGCDRAQGYYFARPSPASEALTSPAFDPITELPWGMAA